MNLRLPAAIVVAVFCSSPCLAQTDARDDALSAIAKCASLADDHARLGCYDAAAPKVKDAMAAPPLPAPAEPQPPTPKEQESWFGLPDIFGGNGSTPQTTPKQFGSDSLPPAPPPAPKPGEPAPPPPPEVIDSITAMVTDFAIHYDGRFIVFLDNGQIWQQLEGDTTAHFRKGTTFKIIISRGLLSSYNLELASGSSIYKVKRLK
jgi:hypothetical protein